MWPNPQETADLVAFTEEIFNEKYHFCAVLYLKKTKVGSMLKRISLKKLRISENS